MIDGNAQMGPCVKTGQSAHVNLFSATADESRSDSIAQTRKLEEEQKEAPLISDPVPTSALLEEYSNASDVFRAKTKVREMRELHYLSCSACLPLRSCACECTYAHLSPYCDHETHPYIHIHVHTHAHVHARTYSPSHPHTHTPTHTPAHI